MFSTILSLLTNGFFLSYIKSKSFEIPLSAKEEEKYLERFFNGDQEARNILIERNLRLVAHIAKKYENNKDLQEDLISIGTIGLIKAVDSYKQNHKTKLATYASRCIENEILMHLRTNKKTSLDVSLNETIGIDKDGSEIVLGDIIAAKQEEFIDIVDKKDTLNKKSTLVKTIVTSELGANIGRKFGLQIEETLTGFKYIGDKINKYEQTGEQEFVIGYEESYGYLVGTHARDKDAVVSSMLICQMASWYKNQGKTLVDGLNEIYDEYGYFLDYLDSFVLKGKDGAEKIQNLMTSFRNKGTSLFDGIEEVIDFSTGIRDLPKENVLKYIWKDGSWMAVRPSGTEPKIKVYYSIVDASKKNAGKRLEIIRNEIKSIINA